MESINILESLVQQHQINMLQNIVDYYNGVIVLDLDQLVSKYIINSPIKVIQSKNKKKNKKKLIIE